MVTQTIEIAGLDERLKNLVKRSKSSGGKGLESIAEVAIKRLAEEFGTDEADVRSRLEQIWKS